MSLGDPLPESSEGIQGGIVLLFQHNLSPEVPVTSQREISCKLLTSIKPTPFHSTFHWHRSVVYNPRPFAAKGAVKGAGRKIPSPPPASAGS